LYDGERPGGRLSRRTCELRPLGLAGTAALQSAQARHGAAQAWCAADRVRRRQGAAQTGCGADRERHLGAKGLAKWSVVVSAALVLLAIVLPLVFINVVEGPAPTRLALPGRGAGAGSPAVGPPSAHGAPVAKSAPSVEGIWRVGSGSVVGYRVGEVLLGQQATAVGRTKEVWGVLEVSGTAVTGATFTVDMASVVSDQDERNAQFDGPIMDVGEYPTATFVLAHPIGLGAVPAVGLVKRYPAEGYLTMHGVRRKVTFTISAERTGPGIDVLADIHIVFADWDIANPSIGGFVRTRSSGTLEVLLDFTKGPGNPAVTAGPDGAASPGGPGPGGSGPGGPGPGGPGPGGPVTVPKTTVPPLTVPAG